MPPVPKMTKRKRERLARKATQEQPAKSEPTPVAPTGQKKADLWIPPSFRVKGAVTGRMPTATATPLERPPTCTKEEMAQIEKSTVALFTEHGITLRQIFAAVSHMLEQANGRA